ncbi:MAG: phage baseplate assembly protein V [Phenylobacterium sp.]|jgi:phage baseplate assembly protein V
MTWSQRASQINSADIQHRLSRIICLGTVAEADYDTARVKVTIGEWTTNWLPWLTTRASNDVDWWGLEVGEQVMVISPSGDMAQGVVIGSIYQQTQHTDIMDGVETESKMNIHRVRYQDGTTIEYDRENHRLKADVIGDVEINVTKPDDNEDSGNITATVAGNVTATVTGDVTATVEGDVTATITGNLTATVRADAALTVEGALTGDITGDTTVTVGGALAATVSGDATVSASNITLEASGNMAISAGGSMSLDAGGDMTLNAAIIRAQ